jgi:hypothetical protein
LVLKSWEAEGHNRLLAGPIVARNPEQGNNATRDPNINIGAARHLL